MATPIDHIKPVTTQRERDMSAGYRGDLLKFINSVTPHDTYVMSKELADARLELAALNHEIEMYDLTQRLLA